MKTKVVTTNAPMPVAAYSQGVVVNNTMYVAGQGPLDVKTNTVSTTVAGQTRQVLENIRAILDAGGFTMNDVVKVTAHLADLKDFEEYNEVYVTYFKEILPVRTTVGSQLNNILVEIDVIAEK